MRNDFPSFYKYDERRSKEIWNSATFVFDANVLLNVYRYPEKVAQELLNTIVALEDRVWVSHNIALEYQINRLKVIAEQRKRVTDVGDLVRKSCEGLVQGLSTLNLDKRHSFIDPGKLVDIFKAAEKKALEQINEFSNKQMDVMDSDPIRIKIDAIFSEKIGPAPANQEFLDNFYAQAKTRYEQGRPPGFEDLKKNESIEPTFLFNGLIYQSAYGDALNWEQLLAHFSTEDSPSVVLVTDDAKRDWWWRVESLGLKTIGLRRELVEEFRARTNSSKILAYSSESFLKFAKKEDVAEISPDSIEFVKDVAERKGRELNIKKIRARNVILQAGFNIGAENAVYEYLCSHYPNAEVSFNGPKFDFLIEDYETDQKIAVEVKVVSDQATLGEIERRLSAFISRARMSDHDLFRIFFVTDNNPNIIASWLSHSVILKQLSNTKVTVALVQNGLIQKAVDVN